MAGTDKTKQGVLGGPVVVLVDPQLGENIGMCARAMLNCGLTELRLVRPRDGWPNEAAVSAAAGADEILERAQLFGSTVEAVADLQRVFATTARLRDMEKPLMTARRAAREMRVALDAGERAGVLFGPERAGLVNDDVALADAAISVPLNPGFSSLNLAQSVLLIGYEWFQTGTEAPPERLTRDLAKGGSEKATKAEMATFFARLEQALDETGFLRPPEKRPTMVRNIRNLFERAELTAQEVQTLHGILSALRKG